MHGFTSLAQVFVMILVSGFWDCRSCLMLILVILGVDCPPRRGASDVLMSTRSARDFPILSRAGERQAAGLSRQRCLGAEAAGGDRCDHAGLCRGIFQCSPGPALPVATLRPRNTRRVRGTIARFLNAGVRRRDRHELGHDRGDQHGRLWLGHAADGGGRRDRPVGHGASRQYRALAFPARTAGRGAEMGRCGRRRRS